jgi:hypothetical protein
MKKSVKKLVLHRESLRLLARPDLAAAAGGNYTAPLSCETICGLICPQPPRTQDC